MSKSHAPLEETWLAAGSLLARDPVRVVACLAVIVPIFLMLAATLAAESRPTLIWVLCASAVLNCGLALLLVDGQRALLKAREGEKSFRDLYENISEGVFRSTLDGRMISANPSLVRLNGYQTQEQLIKAVNSIADEWYVDPNRRAELHEMLLKEEKISDVVSEVYRHGTRERIWIEESVRLVRDKNSGEPLHYDGTLREVTETIRRLELQERYNKIASIVSACLYQHRLRPDGSASMPYASIGLFHIFGVQPQDVAEDVSILRKRIHPDDIARITTSLDHSSRTLTVWQCEYRVLWPEGQTKWVLAHSVPEREADGSTLWHGTITDISERKQAEARIHELAFFDQLTGLPNRTLLQAKLGQALSAASGNRRAGALLFVDLDHFKVLNDSKGHHVGDLLLSEIARRLRRCTGSEDVVARLGGDEFVVLLQANRADLEMARLGAKSVAQRILKSIEQPFLLGGDLFETKASIGITLFDDDTLPVDELLKRADLAMYEAKAAGRGTMRFFEPAMQEAIEDRLALSSDLRQALAEGGLALVYQAQVDRAGWCFGAEALLRWNHPTRGPIPPTEILSLAEQSGLIDGVEEWVLSTACSTLRSWQADPLMAGVQLAVNVSANQLNRREFVAVVEAMLARTGADPTRLRLELTEHAMLHNVEDVIAVMQRLKQLGVSFALDDFGTGYSSLSYLKRLPIDTLKIDRSFVRDIEHDPSDRAIVKTIINIARSLDVSVIAEGVENELQALLLQQLGCHAFQGYLFAQPAELAEFLAFLRCERASERALLGQSGARAIEAGLSGRKGKAAAAGTPLAPLLPPRGRSSRAGGR